MKTGRSDENHRYEDGKMDRVPSSDNFAFALVGPPDAHDGRLRHDLLHTWVAVTDAGGAVGFAAPADAGEIARALDSALTRVAEGSDALGVVTDDRATVGMGFLVASGSPLQRHWRTLMRLMVRPELQGLGAGRVLLEGLHTSARDLGLEQLRLTVRDGCGLEPFYERFGYTVIGRHPGALRVAPGDDRDEVEMVVRLAR
jgi:GNAT superfamily N-acetyltransferase